MSTNTRRSRLDSLFVSVEDEDDEKDEDFAVSDMDKSHSDTDTSDTESEDTSNEADDEASNLYNDPDPDDTTAQAPPEILDDTTDTPPPINNEIILTGEAYDDLFPEEEDDVSAILASSSSSAEDSDGEADDGDNDAETSSKKEQGNKKAADGYNHRDKSSLISPPANNADPLDAHVASTPTSARSLRPRQQQQQQQQRNQRHDIAAAATPSRQQQQKEKDKEEEEEEKDKEEEETLHTAHSPTMQLLEDHLPTLSAEAPIAQRTRAHVSLMEVPIEDLEAMLQELAPGDEPLLRFDVDDAFEYERFLAAIQDNAMKTVYGGEIGATASVATDTEAELDDSDDEDFVNELRRMLEVDDDESENATLHGRRKKSIGELSKTKKKRSKKKQPRRSARLLLRGSARPMYAAKIIHRHNARVSAAGPLAAPAIGLSELAALAAAMGASDSVAMAAQHQHQQHIQAHDRVPLPSEPPELALMAATLVTWRKPLPKAVRRYNKTASTSGGKVIDGHDDSDRAIVGGNYQAEQYSQIYLLMHQHVQALSQTLAMAVATGEASIAASTSDMLTQLEEFSRAQSAARQQLGIPPYVPDFLGMGPAIQSAITEATEAAVMMHREALLGDGGGDGASHDASHTNTAAFPIQRPWTLYYPGPVYTVADVAVLRGVTTMIQEMPAVGSRAATIQESTVSPPEADNTGKTAHGASNAAVQQSMQGRPKKRQRTKSTLHPIWSNLPQAVARAVAPIRAYFDPGAEPHPPSFIVTKQMLFTPAEDSLLAWGIRKHGYDWDKIRADFLPGKSSKVLFHRKKNRIASSAPKNVVKEAVAVATAPLTPAEVNLLEKAEYYYGKQPNRWEIICKEHMPHRHAIILSNLWTNHKRQEGQQAKGVQDLMQPGLLTSSALNRDNNGGMGLLQQQQPMQNAFHNAMSFDAWQALHVQHPEHQIHALPVATDTDTMHGGDQGNGRQQEQQQREGDAEKSATWTAIEEKTLLVTTLKHGGSLSDDQIESLCDSLGKRREELIEKSRVLVDRFKEKSKASLARHTSVV